MEQRYEYKKKYYTDNRMKIKIGNYKRFIKKVKQPQCFKIFFEKDIKKKVVNKIVFKYIKGMADELCNLFQIKDE